MANVPVTRKEKRVALLVVPQAETRNGTRHTAAHNADRRDRQRVVGSGSSAGAVLTAYAIKGIPQPRSCKRSRTAVLRYHAAAQTIGAARARRRCIRRRNRVTDLHAATSAPRSQLPFHQRSDGGPLRIITGPTPSSVWCRAPSGRLHPGRSHPRSLCGCFPC